MCLGLFSVGTNLVNFSEDFLQLIQCIQLGQSTQLLHRLLLYYSMITLRWSLLAISGLCVLVIRLHQLDKRLNVVYLIVGSFRFLRNLLDHPKQCFVRVVHGHRHPAKRRVLQQGRVDSLLKTSLRAVSDVLGAMASGQCLLSRLRSFFKGLRSCLLHFQGIWTLFVHQYLLTLRESRLGAENFLQVLHLDLLLLSHALLASSSVVTVHLLFNFR